MIATPQNNSRRRGLAGARWLWVLLVGLGLSVSGAAQARIIDRIVAIVNDEVVTWSELEELLGPVMQQIEAVGDPVLRAQQREKRLQQGVDELVGQKLISQEAQRRRMTVSAEEIDAYLDQVKSGQGWSDEMLRQYLQAQGLDYGTFRRQIRDQRLRQKVVREVVGMKVRISEGDVREYYREWLTQASTEFEMEAAHIALPVPAEASPAQEAEVRQSAKELLARAQAGEDFAQLARTYSRAPGASEGGGLGTFRRGVLDDSLDREIFSLDEGQVGGPVRTRYGYHVVKVLAKHRLSAASFEEVHEKLQRELSERRMQEELAKWTEELRRKAFVEIRL